MGQRPATTPFTDFMRRSDPKSAATSSPRRKGHGVDSSDERARASVQDYLDRFAVAMTSGDSRTLAQLWEVPAFVIDKERALSVQSLTDVEQFFAGSKAMYNARGITSTRAEIQDLDVIDDDLVMVRVRWPYLDENGDEHGAESSTYTLKRGEDGQLKMRVATMRGARATEQDASEDHGDA
jgi:hypothetical protein